MSFFFADIQWDFVGFRGILYVEYYEKLTTNLARTDSKPEKNDPSLVDITPKYHLFSLVKLIYFL